MLVVTGVAAALTYTQTPIYTAQAKFYLAAQAELLAGGPDRRTSCTAQDLNTYVAVLGSPEVMDPLRESLGPAAGHPDRRQRQHHRRDRDPAGDGA